MWELNNQILIKWKNLAYATLGAKFDTKYSICQIWHNQNKYDCIIYDHL